MISQSGARPRRLRTLAELMAWLPALELAFALVWRIRQRRATYNRWYSAEKSFPYFGSFPLTT